MSDPSTAHVGDVAEHLNTDIERGLTAAEAARRLVATGPNELEEEAPVPAWRKFLAQFQDPLIYLLIAAVVVAFIAWLVDGSDGVPFDVIVIVIIVILNAVLGYVQERAPRRRSPNCRR